VFGNPTYQETTLYMPSSPENYALNAHTPRSPKRLGFFLVTPLAALLVAATAFAAAPPPIASSHLPPVVPNRPDPVLVPHRPGGLPPIPFTLADIERSHLSGVLYQGMLSGLTKALPPTSVHSHAVSPSTLQKKFTIAPNASVTVPPINITGDALQDAEPSVISITDANGVDHTVATWFKYENGDTPNIYYSGTTNFSSFSTPASMPSTGYTYTGDPAMDENPYNANIGPLRMYCAGLAFDDLAHPESFPNAIVLWHTDNSQFTASPTIVDQRWVGTGTNHMTLDKPAVAVSWHNGGSPNDLGNVYVSYTSYDYGNANQVGNTAIVVATSTNGGVSFGTPVVVAYGGAPGGTSEVGESQVVVSSATGNVYVLWVDWSNGGSIQMATSTDHGSTFGTHEVAATGTFTNAAHGGPNGIRAKTVPVARYNSYAGNIGVVWHDSNGTNGFDVRYAYRDANGWHQPSSSIVQYTAGAQFMPAFDYNTTSGNIVVTYYSSSNGTTYRPYEAYCSATGTRIDTTDHDMAGRDQDPPLNGFIGDYQTVWDWTFAAGERATAAWIGYPLNDDQTTGPYDTFLTRISY
jgi:hypothetical protein